MPSNTPLPAAQLLALAGELADEAAIELAQGGFQNRKLHAALDAFVTAHYASPRTQSATLDDIANAVCGSIPDGYEVQLCMENGAGYVTLTTKDGQYASLPDSADKSLEEQINDALEVAKEHARRLAGEGGA